MGSHNEKCKKILNCPRTRIMFATTVNALTIELLPEIADGVYELREEYGSRSWIMYEKTYIQYGVASGSLFGVMEINYPRSVPLDIREMYMNKYFEHGDFMKKTNWQKLYNYLENI